MESRRVALHLQALNTDAGLRLALDPEVRILLARRCAHLLCRELQQLHLGGRHDGRRLTLRLRQLMPLIVVGIERQIGTTLDVRGLPDLLIALDRLGGGHVRHFVLQRQCLHRLRIGEIDHARRVFQVTDDALADDLAIDVQLLADDGNDRQVITEPIRFIDRRIMAANELAPVPLLDLGVALFDHHGAGLQL